MSLYQKIKLFVLEYLNMSRLPQPPELLQQQKPDKDVMPICAVGHVPCLMEIFSQNVDPKAFMT
jgi:hypothetical protein